MKKLNWIHCPLSTRTLADMKSEVGSMSMQDWWNSLSPVHQKSILEQERTRLFVELRQCKGALRQMMP